MTTEDLRRAVVSIPAFADVDPSALDWLASVVRERTFAAGEVLVYEHSNTRECYFILDGSAEVTVGGSTVGGSEPGDIEGEIALLFETPRSATVRALEQTHTLVLSESDFDDALHSKPEVAEALRDAIAAYLRTKFQQR